MPLFQKYIRQKWRVIAILALFCVTFGVVFSLYHLPIGAVVYPSLLCALFGIIFILIDFIHVKRRHEELKRLSRLPASMINELPVESSIDGEDYQIIIRTLQSEAAGIETISAARYQDMLDYFTIWAHQIKTPIAAMRLNLQNTDHAGSRKLLSELFRIEQYVEMVLAFLRLDSETSDYVFKEHSVDKMIRSAVKKFSSEFIGRKISLQYEPVGLTLVTDEKWLSFVLEQVISNALKYTREGCIKIYLCQPKTLCIEDTGIGIAPEDLPRIFEKGYTGYNGRIDQKASGIGLYLCKRVCDNLGIKITAESEIGRGTVIKLCLGQHEIRRE